MGHLKAFMGAAKGFYGSAQGFHGSAQGLGPAKSFVQIEIGCRTRDPLPGNAQFAEPRQARF